MSASIQGRSGASYLVQGPYDGIDSVKNVGGVYVIVCETALGPRVLDVGQSGDLKTRIGTHDREDCWSANCQGGRPKFYLHLTPGMTRQERESVEADIRAYWNPPCGQR